MYPERALSLVVGGAGYGSVSADRASFHRDTDTVIAQFEQGGMAKVAEFYTRGPTRVQLMAKDPVGWKEFYDRFAGGSALGHANTMRGVQRRRPSIFELEAKLERLTVPTLIMTGDEDDPCLEPGIFMKRKIRSSGLVVIPKAGHTINLEDPELFNRALLDFLTAVDAGRWPLRNPQSQTGSAIMPAKPK
jgi:pimeloyl-ACP methyl ester carboxylesterase